MAPGQMGSQTDTHSQDFPARPIQQSPEDFAESQSGKHDIRRIILISLTYFTYGLGTGLNGPLYSRKAYELGVDSRIYGSVIATRYLSCLVAYPIACLMVTSVSNRLFTSISIFTIGTSHVLFGTVALMKHNVFIYISFAVQVAEGIGTSMLLVATILSSSGSPKLMRKMSLSIQLSLSLGLAVSPVIGKLLNDLIGFDKAYYSVGSLIVLVFVFTAVFLPAPDNQVEYEDIPVVLWLKNKRMIFYFLILTGTFIYAGYITVCLEHILWKFHLSNLEVGLVFSILPLACGVTLPGWTLIIGLGFNSVMKIFIGSVIVLGSLLILGPIPFVHLEASVMNVCIALLVSGLGIACKCACLIDSMDHDLRTSKLTALQQQLSFPTIFCLGAYFGQFIGSLTSGFADFYISFGKATLILFGLEILIGVSAVVFAFNRNYRSRTLRDNNEERQHILRT